ncbi:MAG TPA: hypothetical protein P5121_08715 [Caldilineaceae bacterium]|nr:hypothetical protein [Caldilineaceae bacterium]
MTIENVNGPEYGVEYNVGSHAISFIGTIRLQSNQEYAPIMTLLDGVHDALDGSSTLTLDFRQLRFLNSSGINTISRFVIKARKADKVLLKVLGNQEIYWQQKTLVNLQRLWPTLQVEIQ